MRYVQKWVAAVSSCLVLCSAAGAAAQKTADVNAADMKNQAVIPFATHGGIANWQVENDQTVYIQDRLGLPFAPGAECSHCR